MFRILALPYHIFAAACRFWPVFRPENFRFRGFCCRKRKAVLS
nr:MAG TPA: hypothetical protein [Caudoviricetes sp.]